MQLIHYFKKTNTEKINFGPSIPDPTGTDHINNCPSRLIQYIFTFLSPNELNDVKKICKKWRVLSTEKSLWKSIVVNKRPNLATKKLDFEKLWKIETRNSLLEQHSKLEEKIISCEKTSEPIAAFALQGNTIFIPCKNGSIECFDIFTGKKSEQNIRLHIEAPLNNIQSISMSEKEIILVTNFESEEKCFKEILKFDLATNKPCELLKSQKFEKKLNDKDVKENKENINNTNICVFQETIYCRENCIIYNLDLTTFTSTKIMEIQPTDKVSLQQDAIYVEKTDKTVHIYDAKGNFLNSVAFEGNLLFCTKNKIYTYTKTPAIFIQVWDVETKQKILDSPLQGIDNTNELLSVLQLKASAIQGNLLILTVRYFYKEENICQDGVVFFDITNGHVVKNILLRSLVHSFIITPEGKIVVHKKNYPLNLKIYELLSGKGTSCTIF